MTHETMQRAYGLVEELRAEVDFEIDDVISTIIRNLPEEYFRSLPHDDQLIHLKALLAISICNLKTEMMLRSEDGRHVAVIARKNYPGLLAGIIGRLPRQQPLIGAKIFTSKTHDFIIDLFEFQVTVTPAQPVNQLEIDDTISNVASTTGHPVAAVNDFVSQYVPGSPVLESADEVREHFLAVQESKNSNDFAVRWQQAEGESLAKLTVSGGKFKARELFLKASQFLATESIDIQQAFLEDFRFDDLDPTKPDQPKPEVPGPQHIAVASFLVSGELSCPPQSSLIDFLRHESD